MLKIKANYHKLLTNYHKIIIYSVKDFPFLHFPTNQYFGDTST